MIENSKNKNISSENTSMEIRQEINKYLIHWKWFVLTCLFSVIISVIFVKTKSNIYKTKASVLVKEDGGMTSDLKVFNDLSSLGMGASSNVFDEVEILKSRTLAESFTKELKLNVELFEKQTFKNVELYSKRPLGYEIILGQENIYKLDTFIDITVLDKNRFKYLVESSEEEKEASFGEKVSIGKYKIAFFPTMDILENKDKQYRFKFTKLENVIVNYTKKVKVESIDDYSNVIELSIEHTNKAKAKDVLNSLIYNYNQMSIDDQNLIAKKTDKFITDKLVLIKAELDKLDKEEELYKSNREITDITIQSQIFVDAKSENGRELFNKKTQLSLINYMIDEIKNGSAEFKMLPSSIGITEVPQLSNSIDAYNKILIDRNRDLITSSISNPIVKHSDVILKEYLENITESLLGAKKQLEIAISSLSKEERKFKSKISELPKQVREYRGIIREQTIVAELYSYLLQKKEENEISMAVTVSKSKIIDSAYSLSDVVAPKKKAIVLIGLILGLIIPFLVIYCSDLLNTKFKTRGELEKSISAPILGDIPFDTSGEKIVVTKGSRTSTAEAFRLLRTNLDFMLSSAADSSSKTIFVTSTISGEGKTFVAANVAASIALTGKKVLLTGMDLRAPKISQYLGLPNRKGVSNFLVDKNLLLEDLISPLDGFDNLDFLSSGVVPPNPAELLLSSRMKNMFSELNEIYDYIVVDTAPVNLVTDTLMISQYADLFVYTVRSNYLDKSLLEVPERMYIEKRLPNMAVLLNGLDYTRGYGYGGYGYPKEDTHKNVFQRLFKK